jgi:hypothetical protein
LVAPGTYTYTYDISVNAGVVTDDFPVQITFVDPCDPPTITEPAAGSFEYTLTDTNPATLVLNPEYSVDPSWCLFDISMTKPGDSVIDPNLNLDPTPQDVVLDPIPATDVVVDPITGELSPSGPTETTYPVTTTITTTGYDGTPTTSDVDHDLIIKNPCINPAYVTIDLPATLPNLMYTVENGPEVYAAIAANF